MINENPIKMKDDGLYPEFIIPKKYLDKKIFVTTQTELAKIRWEMDLIHALSLAGKPLDFDPQPDLEKAEIGLCRDIKNKRFALISIVTRIKDGGTGKPPKVKYSIQFETEDELVDGPFEVTSDETNPVTFYTKITFKVR